jgi:hypothetical protein
MRRGTAAPEGSLRVRGSVRDHSGAALRYGSWADVPSPSDSPTRESDWVGASPRWGCKPGLAKPSEVEDGGEIMTMASTKKRRKKKAHKPAFFSAKLHFATETS